MNNAELYVMPSPEIMALVSDNETSLKELLAASGHSGLETRFSRDPTVNYTSGAGKDLMTVFVGASIAIVALTPLMKRALELLAGRPVIVTETVLRPIEDSSGKPLLDAQGKPLLQWVELKKAVPNEVKAENTSTSLEGPFGLKIQFETTQR